MIFFVIPTDIPSIASDTENLTAITTLAGMGILTADDNLVDAALSEILALPIDQKHSLDQQRHVDYLLIQHHLSQVSFIYRISSPQNAFLKIYSNILSKYSDDSSNFY